jgi:hypothetical protein
MYYKNGIGNTCYIEAWGLNDQENTISLNLNTINTEIMKQNLLLRDPTYYDSMVLWECIANPNNNVSQIHADCVRNNGVFRL